MKSRNMLGRWIRAKAPVLVAGVALIGSGAVVGIGGSGAASAAAKNKKVTITFWNAYNDVTETPVMNGIVIPAFERLHPNIKVIDETLPYDGMLNKFIAASAGGNPPNLMRSDIAWVPQLASEGILLETSKQPWFAAVKKDAFPGPMSTNYWKGGYWGIPDDTNTQVLFWNKADFAAANLSGPPTTWAQMISDAQTLTIASKGQHGLGVDSTDIWNVGPFVWAYGGSFTNSNATKASGYMDSSATQAAVQQLITFQQSGVIGSDFAGGSGAISGETGFPTGQYAMYLDGPWATTTYKNANFTGYGTALVPGNPNSSSVVGGEDFVVPKNAKNMAQTLTFLRFLQSPTAQLDMVTAGSMTPYRSDAVHEAVINPALKIFSQQLLTAKARPVNQYYSMLDTDFSNQVALMLAGKVTVAQGLATAAQQSDSALQGKG